MYKVVVGDKIVDVGIDKRFVKRLSNNVVIMCSEGEATGLLSTDDEYIYSLTELKVFGDIVNIEDISEEEYNIYKERLDNNESVNKDYYTELLDKIDVLDYVLKVKLEEMSFICNQTIINGTDIELTDGNKYHFSLTTEDQLNLSALQVKIMMGQTLLSYHNDSGDCVFYSKDDMMRIMQACEEFKIYHLTYFNSLRKYIQSLKDINKIKSITYGVEIPEEFQTDVLRTILGGSDV